MASFQGTAAAVFELKRSIAEAAMRI